MLPNICCIHQIDWLYFILVFRFTWHRSCIWRIMKFRIWAPLGWWTLWKFWIWKGNDFFRKKKKKKKKKTHDMKITSSWSSSNEWTNRNCISDMNQVENLSLCTSLSSITFEGNPFVEDFKKEYGENEYKQTYNQFLKQILPYLSVLDDESLTIKGGAFIL